MQVSAVGSFFSAIPNLSPLKTVLWTALRRRGVHQDSGASTSSTSTVAEPTSNSILGARVMVADIHWDISKTFGYYGGLCLK